MIMLAEEKQDQEYKDLQVDSLKETINQNIN
jgi:hypothetical protein